MSNERDWMTPAEVEAMLGVELTRPRRWRLLAKLEESGIRVQRPAPNMTLISRPDLVNFIADIERGRRERPTWLP